jgi:dTDP-glucose 4,6-dehydratase
MRVLVTGGAGFIGSHYVRTMLTGGYPGYDDAEVTVFDKLTYAGNLANLAPVANSPRYRFVQGDICVPADLDAALPGHDVVVNFAAGSWTEDHLLEPNSPYSAAKAGSDLIARAYAQTYGLDISITRCSNNYGPYHFPEKVIPLFVTNLLDGHKVPLYGAGANVRDWLFVDDHCRGIQLVVEQGKAGEYYNIGGGRELSNKELTEQLLDATGRDWSFVENIVDPRGGGHDLRYSVDYSKTAALGYAPRMTFEDGLALTVQWYRDNRAWWEPLKASAATARS